MRFKRSVASFVLLGSLLSHQAWGWRELQPGLEFEKTGSIDFFRIDLRKNRIDLLLATDDAAPALPAIHYRTQSNALLVINGGFFGENFKALGLLVRKGQLVNPLRNVDWGIFQMQPAGPAILHRRQWKPEGVETALQVGPRLVVDGTIPSFKPEAELHRRSAVGIAPDGWLVIALCESPIKIQDWAEALKKITRAALNLDGGGSSQISVKVKDFSLEIPGTTNVPNALAVFAR